MSKHNKVNPGIYTQAGRLTPDDTARELKKQRETAASSSKTQPRKSPPERVTEKDKQDEDEESEDSSKD